MTRALRANERFLSTATLTFEKCFMKSERDDIIDLNPMDMIRQGYSESLIHENTPGGIIS